MVIIPLNILLKTTTTLELRMEDGVSAGKVMKVINSGKVKIKRPLLQLVSTMHS